MGTTMVSLRDTQHINNFENSFPLADATVVRKVKNKVRFSGGSVSEASLFHVNADILSVLAQVKITRNFQIICAHNYYRACEENLRFLIAYKCSGVKELRSKDSYTSYSVFEDINKFVIDKSSCITPEEFEATVNTLSLEKIEDNYEWLLVRLRQEVSRNKKKESLSSFALGFMCNPQVVGNKEQELSLFMEEYLCGGVRTDLEQWVEDLLVFVRKLNGMEYTASAKDKKEYLAITGYLVGGMLRAKKYLAAHILLEMYVKVLNKKE